MLAKQRRAMGRASRMRMACGAVASCHRVGRGLVMDSLGWVGGWVGQAVGRARAWVECRPVCHNLLSWPFCVAAITQSKARPATDDLSSTVRHDAPTCMAWHGNAECVTRGLAWRRGTRTATHTCGMRLWPRRARAARPPQRALQPPLLRRRCRRRLRLRCHCGWRPARQAHRAAPAAAAAAAVVAVAGTRDGCKGG